MQTVRGNIRTRSHRPWDRNKQNIDEDICHCATGIVKWVSNADLEREKANATHVAAKTTTISFRESSRTTYAWVSVIFSSIYT